MTSLTLNSERECRSMFEKIKHIPLSEKDLVIGFIYDIMKERPILMICGLVAVYYYQTEEFCEVNDDMEMNHDKTVMTCSNIRHTFVEVYGRIVIAESANYIATWRLRFLSPSQRLYCVHVGISSKYLGGHIFYTSDIGGHKWKRESNDLQHKYCGKWKGFESDKILTVTLDPKNKQLQMACGNASTCFDKIEMKHGPFRLFVTCLFMKGSSLEIIKFEKNY